MNLIDNSIYWLSTKGSRDKRIYLGSSLEIPGGPVLFVADNGPGFQDPTDMLTQPFMSRRPEGMGLGLHIASEIMKAHDGKLIFPDADDLGLDELYDGAIVGLQFKE
jgi:nitrogen-specific signal transduction histidine kinase